MGRAHGRNGPPRPAVVVDIDPDSPEGRQLGMSRRTQGVPAPIPGGRPHISNAPVVRQTVPVPEPDPEITYLNSHGVPHGSATSRERAEVERGPNSVHQDPPEHRPRVEKPAPIPVFLVQDHNKDVYRTASPRHFVLNPSTGDAQRICGRDPSRARVLILNESTTGDLRFARLIADLNGGGGALLSHLSTSYLALTTQDELYAISADGSSPTISVIQEFEQPWGG